MFKFKPTKREITSAEAYLVAFATTAFGLYSSGDHQIKKIAWSAAVAVLGPVYVSMRTRAKAYLVTKAGTVRLRLTPAEALIAQEAIKAAKTALAG